MSPTATLLPDGRASVIGGYPAEGAAPTGSTEVYDPQRNRFLMFGSLQVPGTGPTTQPRCCPTVLYWWQEVGGADGASARQCRTRRPEDRRRAAGSTAPRTEQLDTATAVPGGVLLTGGTGTGAAAMRSTVEYVAAAGRWRSGPDLLRARVKHAAAALPDGCVLVVGGAPSVESRHRFADTELVDPVAGPLCAGPAVDRRPVQDR